MMNIYLHIRWTWFHPSILIDRSYTHVILLTLHQLSIPNSRFVCPCASDVMEVISNQLPFSLSKKCHPWFSFWNGKILGGLYSVFRSRPDGKQSDIVFLNHRNSIFFGFQCHEACILVHLVAWYSFCHTYAWDNGYILRERLIIFFLVVHWTLYQYTSHSE